MGPLPAKRRLAVYVALLGGGLAVCGWQVQEHVRFKRNAELALVNRGRDITDTLSIVIRSQRGRGPVPFAQFVERQRLEPALNDLIRPGELEAIAIVSPSGKEVARAGNPIGVTPADLINTGGVVWGEQTVTLMSLSDWNLPEDRPTIIVNEDASPGRGGRPPNRRPPPPGEGGPGNRNAAGGPVPAESASAAVPASAPTPTIDTKAAEITTSAATPAATPPPRTEPPRLPFGRWATEQEWQAVQAYWADQRTRQGVQSLVISLSTVQMQRAVKADLLLRSLVSLLAMGGAIITSLAWRNVGKNAELQIRLVKAGEMNTHLKEMNLAAAGLAHETRNPLNIIRGLAQMISMQAQDAPRLKSHAATIVEEADRVTVQLNEFINYSKPREPLLAPVEAMGLVADVARTLLPDFEEKRIEFVHTPSPLRIEADEQLLRQAIFNVILNATQAVTVGGRIEVRLALAGAREAVLEIADNGPGVPEAERVSIFKPYVTMRPKGVGLGLAIVAQIAAVHHWEVACLAHQPQGALFRFSHLKIAPPA